MARWQSCNIFKPDAASRHLWQFDAARDGFKLNREHAIPFGKPLPQGTISKSWDSLWRGKLNVALLPAEKVFLRVLQLPVVDDAEARQIVELQLERLSPLPVTQVVWSLHLLPKGNSATRPAIVLIADRSAVEKYLGQLEAEGFLADRLELPELDQVLATTAQDDGAWIYPVGTGGASLVAWWAGGELRSLAWLNLPEDEKREVVLQEQLMQMAWAGELEGWLNTSPRFHLVAEAPLAAVWRPLFEKWVESPLEVTTPLPPPELVARTARRAAASSSSLLPAEFVKRYHQQFVDRLWMRGLFAVVMLYLFGVLIYLAAMQVVELKLGKAEKLLVETGGAYTNVVQLKARYEVLRDRADLKFAALDCWKALAEELPEGVVLQGMSFGGGRLLTVNGTAPTGETEKILDLYGRLRRLTPNGRQLFNRMAGEAPIFNTMAGGASVTWRFSVELDRSETQ